MKNPSNPNIPETAQLPSVSSRFRRAACVSCRQLFSSCAANCWRCKRRCNSTAWRLETGNWWNKYKSSDGKPWRNKKRWKNMMRKRWKHVGIEPWHQQKGGNGMKNCEKTWSICKVHGKTNVFAVPSVPKTTLKRCSNSEKSETDSCLIPDSFRFIKQKPRLHRLCRDAEPHAQTRHPKKSIDKNGVSAFIFPRRARVAVNSNPKHLELCVRLRCTFGAIMFSKPLFNPYNGYNSKETVFTFSFGGEHWTYHVNIHLNRYSTSSFFKACMVRSAMYALMHLCSMHGMYGVYVLYERKCCVCYVCVCVCYVPYVCVLCYVCYVCFMC